MAVRLSALRDLENVNFKIIKCIYTGTQLIPKSQIKLQDWLIVHEGSRCEDCAYETFRNCKLQICWMPDVKTQLILNSGHAWLGQSVAANVQIVLFSHAVDTLNYFPTFPLTREINTLALT
jgi:hypothetical protein